MHMHTHTHIRTYTSINKTTFWKFYVKHTAQSACIETKVAFDFKIPNIKQNTLTERQKKGISA